MKSIRRTGSALLAVAALSLPSLVLAEDAPSALCDGVKHEGKAPTAERSKQEAEKSDQKSDQQKNKSEQSKEKPDQTQARRTS